MITETLKDMEHVQGFNIYNSDKTEGSALEDDFIIVNSKDNSVKFILQNGPIGEAGVNGCQMTAMIEVARYIINHFNDNFPCRENTETLTKLDEALMWQRERTRERENRGVEGFNKA